MSRKKMDLLLKELGDLMVLTSPPDNGEKKHNYYLCFINTRKVIARTYTIKEMIEELNYIKENGICINN